MQLYEKKSQRIFYVLYDIDGDPKTGLLSSDITLRYIKSDETEFSIKTLMSGEDGNFGEVGYGLYYTDFTEDETDTLGQFAITINSLSEDPGPSPPSPLPSGPVIESKHLIYEIVPEPIVPGGEVKTCRVFGNVRELGGIPGEPTRVIGQLLELPHVVDGKFIKSKIEDAYSNIDGTFVLKLIVGATVRVEIPDTGTRRQFVVPDQTTANLKDLPSE